MLALSILSIVFLLIAAVMIVHASKLRGFPYISLLIFIVIQIWFSVQWSYFLATGNVIVGSFSSDWAGLFLANLSVFLPLGFLYLSKRYIPWSRFAALLGVILVGSLAVTSIHFLISSPCRFCAFTIENDNITLNLWFQLIIDIVLFVSFAFILFDQEFRVAKNRQALSSIATVFGIFYVNDILIQVSRLTAKSSVYTMEVAMWVEVAMVFAFSLGILYLGILVFRRDNPISIAKPKKHEFDTDLINSDWLVTRNNAKQTSMHKLADEIDRYEFLSKNEKLYMFLCHLDDVPTKKLSELLHVSPRTVETNKYRLRKKLEAHQISM